MPPRRQRRRPPRAPPEPTTLSNNTPPTFGSSSPGGSMSKHTEGVKCTPLAAAAAPRVTASVAASASASRASSAGSGQQGITRSTCDCLCEGQGFAHGWAAMGGGSTAVKCSDVPAAAAQLSPNAPEPRGPMRLTPRGRPPGRVSSGRQTCKGWPQVGGVKATAAAGDGRAQSANKCIPSRCAIPGQCRPPAAGPPSWLSS